MFLATTALIETWDDKDLILLLGPWCLLYSREEEWKSLRYSMLPCPWQEPRAIAEADKYCSRVMDSLIPEFAASLNRIHGVDYGERYWKIILGSWLLYYVHVLYDRYVSLKRALESYLDLKTAILNPSCFVTPVDTLDFTNLVFGESADVYNLQLYSQIIRAKGLSSKIGREINLSPDDLKDIGRLNQKKQDPAQILKNVTKNACTHLSMTLARFLRPKIMLGGVRMSALSLIQVIQSMAKRGFALPGPFPISYGKITYDKNMRSLLTGFSPKDEFTDIFVQSLPANLPKIFLEGYQNLRKKALSRWPFPPSVLVSSVDWYFNEIFKFLAAEFGDRGSRLIGLQQGGGYGLGKAIPQEGFEFSITDRWISYGWRNGQDHENHPLIDSLPHPRFQPSRIRKDGGARNRQKDVLLIATSFPRYPFRFESCPSGQFDSVLEWRIRFIRSVGDSLRPHLVVRLHGEDFGWCQEERIHRECNSIRLSNDQRRLKKYLGRTRVAVIEYPGTAMLEMLAENVPILLFWESRLWEMREEAQPYLENFREAGILWNSPEEAALKLTEIYEDPWRWWGGASIQKIRLGFAERFAQMRKDWLEPWVALLKEEIAMSSLGRK